MNIVEHTFAVSTKKCIPYVWELFHQIALCTDSNYDIAINVLPDSEQITKLLHYYNNERLIITILFTYMNYQLGVYVCDVGNVTC